MSKKIPSNMPATTEEQLLVRRKELEAKKADAQKELNVVESQLKDIELVKKRAKHTEALTGIQGLLAVAEHDRGCSDGQRGDVYRCVRCALLEFREQHYIPDDVKIRVEVQFNEY